jgi:deoxyribodipyrimidine photolyase-related protein
MADTLRLILGDQLNSLHSWFEKTNPGVTYVMMEVLPETAYVMHHVQKVAGFFAVMRRFAAEMQKKGHRFIYYKLDDSYNRQSFEKNISYLVENKNFEKFEYLLPDEYRLDQQLAEFAKALGIPTEAHDSEHFMSAREEVREFFKNRKTYVMETFYRHIRQKYNIMMEDGEPLSGRWNFDAENRRSLPKDLEVPPPKLFKHDVSDIVKMLQKMEVKTFGSIDAQNFPWPLSRKESLECLDHFLRHLLQNFGKYQDAMVEEHPYLFHSRLSFALNIKMISPLEVAEKTVAFWQQHREEIDIAQVEGFVRQIIGWREYMRGIYWDKMPEYETLNFFGHRTKLPGFYWTGDTNMNCLKHTVTQSLEKAYAHHIQRLMITGNFALLAGVHPDEVDAWYLGIYIDAIQWVEITNTRGMSQFADGGIAATKPYVSSANYINKMSDYCANCFYNKSKRHGERACPFNSLYWDFFETHREKLENNHRLGLVYRNLNKMDGKERKKIRRQAADYLKRIDEL